MTSAQALAWLSVIATLAVAGVLTWYWSRDSFGDLRHSGAVAIPVPPSEKSASAFPEYYAPPRSAVTDTDAVAARALNASLAEVPTAITPALPFLFDQRLPTLDRFRARECLAAAVYYEAGSESILGQRAVAQVVLNRVRHPAFPHSVCGVVFQGSERATGCQFTFTCDGSLRRMPSVAGWRRALAIADMALAGTTVPQVGTATHYHTDWVAPVWRTSLTKLATIGTHIFYTWQGTTGSRRAFNIAYRGGEIDYRQSMALAASAVVPPTTIIDPASGLPSPMPTSLGLPDAPAPVRAPVNADKSTSGLVADENRGTLAADKASGTLAR